MEIDLTLKNYRCFPDSHPARISIRKGFTAFVGPNNSGKSSMLKFFFEFRHLLGELSQEHVLVRGLKGEPQDLHLRGVTDSDEVFSNGNNRELEILIDFIGLKGTVRKPVLRTLIISVKREPKTWTCSLRLSNGLTISKDPNVRQTFAGELSLDDRRRVSLEPVSEVCASLSKTLYVGPFRNILTVGGGTPYYDLQVGQSFVGLWKNFKAGLPRKNSRMISDLTKNIARIFDLTDLEINTSEKDDELLVFVNGDRFGLSEMGSGLSQFIVVLANAAINSPHLILIDEPELNLHPTLQLDFLTTLASYAQRGILFSTHSIGLARSSAESIYSFRKITQGQSEVHPYETTPRLSEFLGELSFSSYRELGFEKVLLVEGRTEIKTIQQFLRKMKKDHKVLLISLGGSDFINDVSAAELEEVCRIAPRRVFALIDSEKNTAAEPLAAKRTAFANICKELKIKCHVLKRRAIENYFTELAIKKVKGDSAAPLYEFEKLSKALNSWSKAENWKIAREMSLEDLMVTDLGKFLAKI
jgi:ABC-type Mn2+/Zn2+ transport system ATPase subunit